MSNSSPASEEPTSVYTCSFLPNHVLRTVAASMNWRDEDIAVHVKSEMTWKSATTAVLNALGDRDGPVHIYAPRPSGAKAYLRQLALEEVSRSGSGSIQGLPLRNAPNLASLPSPRPTPQSVRVKLKENLRNETELDRKPYLLIITAAAEDRYLPSIPGKITLSGIDSLPGDPELTISRPDILFDTAAHTSCITEDVLDSKFRQYLSTPIHDPYRCKSGVKVQVSGVFGFGDQPPLQMDCIFTVVPLDSIPNQRSGIILGQNSVIDSFQYSSKPRKTLIARGEEVPNTVWGDIVIDGYVSVDGNYIPL